MKKIVTAIITAAVVLCGTVMSASAVTKQELIEKFKTIPSSKYVITQVENLAKTVDVTDEQAAKLNTLLDNLKTSFPDDKGENAKNYTDAQVDLVFSTLDEATETMNMTYELKSAEGVDGTSVIATFYDANNNVVCTYSNGVLKTGENASNHAWIWAVASVAVLGAAVVVFVVARKNKAEA